VDEKVLTGFAKAGFALNLGVEWSGSLGVQVVHVRQTGNGLYVDANGNGTPYSDGASYTDVLPALMMVGDLGAGTKLRIGVARAVARPNNYDMRGGITAGVCDDLLWSGDGGNPRLKPWLSTDFDLSLEHYFAAGSYFAVALFDKQINRGIITKDIAFDFTGFNNPTTFVPSSSLGTLSTPTNISGGWVRGAEFSLTVDAKTLLPALEGFGFSGSWSITDSNLPGTNADGTINLNTKLEGLSHDVGSATIYYEKSGFQFRVGERYRSGFTATRHNAFRFVMDTIRPEFITDVQAGYTIQHGALKGLGALVEVNNLFDEPYVVTQTAEGQTVLKEYHQFGRQYLFGLSYKF
jgi:iron complex outermembrane receptor protein